MRFYKKFICMLGNSEYDLRRKNFREIILIDLHPFSTGINRSLKFTVLGIFSVEFHKLESARNAVGQKKKEEEAHFGEERRAETSLLSAAIVPHIKNARNICTSEKNSFRSRKAWSFDGRAKRALTTFPTWLRWICFRELSRYIRHREVKSSHDRNYRKEKMLLS